MTSNFKPFAAKIAAAFQAMSQGELHVVDIAGDDIWQAYLAAFPPGTNEIYRVRTEHDGSYDRAFVRKLGNVVRLKDGKVTSIWDTADLPAPYDVVAAVLAAKVRNAPIVGVYRTKEATLGYESSVEQLEGGATHRWYHFHAKIDRKHQATSPDEARGQINTNIGVYKRALTELKLSAFDDVLDLINSNGLYRGDEHKANVTALRALFLKAAGIDDAIARNRFVWESFAANPMGVTLLRNTVIGTLLVDLSEGVPLETAVRSFESKVAPANYRRPTALITQRMVDDAAATLAHLGLESALDRRLAVMSDISVNNVLWVDNSVKAQMKDGIAGLLAKDVKAPKIKPENVVNIGMDQFVANILPVVSSMEVLFANPLAGNLVTLTAPGVADAEKLFKWNNGFAWSYAGNIADSEMRRAVQERGGRVDGVFRFTHMWNYEKRNASLMDLHVFMPGHGGQRGNNHGNYGNDNRVGWNHRKNFASGGVQDVDYVQAAPVGFVPVENITFPDIKKMPDGVYACAIHNWSFRSPTEGGFKAEIEFGGQVFEYEHKRPLKQNEWVEVAEVTLKNGQFTIDHKLPHGAASVEHWGLKTETFIKVNTLLLSPNFWDDQAVGNKHWFFILEGCATDEPTRGIYNEFLRNDLDKHRKVFEVLGNRTKCPASAEQLSGLGFSSTQRNTLTVRVKGTGLQATYNINF